MPDQPAPKPTKPTNVREPSNVRPPSEPTPEKPMKPEAATGEETDIQTEGM